ncbi:phospholipid scramblase, putative [Hepatocystis sp. ex Piliocolobus tephrosceles]|nr:phospholipid scramblase, putative [Hepatocystis sp. ex Piliocolobus tephrosceles]
MPNANYPNPNFPNANMPNPNYPNPNMPNPNYPNPNMPNANFPNANMPMYNSALHNTQIHAVPHIMPPPQQNMNAFTNNWKNIINPLKGCKIKQMFDDREFLASFVMGINVDFNNRYMILDDETDLLNFTAIEQSKFCSRNCLSKQCNPISFKLISPGKPLTKPDVLVEKDCSCTICCLDRPTIKLYDVVNNNEKKLIGTIKNPFGCCFYNFKLLDSSNNNVIYMHESCCQLSLLCPCPCGPCKTSNFFLHDTKNRKEVAHIQKKVPFIRFVKEDIDNYNIRFEKVINPEWKMMLLALVLYLDYMYYDIHK